MLARDPMIAEIIYSRREKIERAMDSIRGRFGKGAISSGTAVKNNLGIGPDGAGVDKG